MLRSARTVLCLLAATATGCTFSVAGISFDGPTANDASVDASSPDLGGVDAGDMAPSSDAATTDLAGADLVLVDASDLAPSDLATPDLAMPDMAMPDLAMPDLAMPDLAMPDLAMPDLTPVRDLVLPSGWSNESSGTTSDLEWVWGANATDIYAVGLGGTIIHSYDGVTWVPQPNPASIAGKDLYGVWGSGASNIWAAGANTTILHSTDGLTWSSVSSPSGIPTTTTYLRIWGAGNTLFIFGAKGYFAYTNDGGQTFGAGRINPNAGDVWGVWGFSPSDVYAAAVGDELWHFDGANWSQVFVYDLWSVWGTDSQHLYTGGNGPLWIKQNGSFQKASVPFQVYDALWGSSLSDIYAVGKDGVVLRSTDGTTFAAEPITTTATLHGIWGPGTPGSVYVVGSGGTILHRVP